MVVTGFIRLVTCPQVFVDPDPIEDAIGFGDALLKTPDAQVSGFGDEWPRLRDKSLRLDLKGNLLTDGWIASAVEAHSGHLASFDRDFARPLPVRDLTLLRAAN